MIDRLKYVFGRIIHMDYKGLFKTVGIVHQKTKKNSLAILIDVVKCGFKFGAGYSDYLLCEFYNINDELRATYVTRSVNDKLVSLLNNREYYNIFDNKDEFYSAFSDCMGREWLEFSKANFDEFKAFMENREEIISKPLSESCGIGVEKLKKSDYATLEELHEALISINSGIIEDVIVQHSELSRMNPGSVNTLRIVTILSEDGPHIVYAYIRIGNSNRPVDNINAGGMCAPIDVDSGVIHYPGYDKDRNIYFEHPKTGCEIVGFKVPFWNETIKLCEKAATVVPQMRYIGWDVSVTENGPLFVEGNNFPGYDILQMPPHLPDDKIGMLPTFRKYIEI